MLKHSKWRGQDPKKVMKKKGFEEWLFKRLRKAVEKNKDNNLLALD